ncbi:MAG: hypothetical protein D6773_12475, partial [Alphaproteobacteria bacterium]
MKMRKHILMNSVAIPAIAAFFAVAAPLPLLAKESGTGARGLRLAQSSGSTAPGHHKVTKGDQKYPGSASRIKQRPRPQAQAVAQLESEAIKPPSDPVARKAFNVLEKHCARCHQAGRLVNRTKPDKDFGNVLKLDEIARNTSLVLPGNPDASPLFTQIVNRQMPYDVYRQNSGGAEPTAEELDALRNWIESLRGADQTVAAVCGARKPVDLATLTSMIAADVDKAAADRRAGLRYVTLSHLYNSCADAAEMAAYRQAVVKLLNALSRKQGAVAVETVGAEAGILRFHLDDLGWSAAEWNRILAAYPYAMGPRGESAAALRERTGTPLPWIRGDWLAYTASRAPLYHELAQRPAGSESLKEQLDSGGQTISALNARL